MKRIFSVLLALAFAASLILLTTTSNSRLGARPAYANSGCSDATIAGTYGFTFAGFNKTTPTRTVPFDGVGVATFDGVGNVSATFTSSLNGEISKGNTYSASYSVNSDCTGSFVGREGGDNFDFVVLHNGAEILAVDTSEGETIILNLKKQ